jgi:hypothetical protein
VLAAIELVGRPTESIGEETGIHGGNGNVSGYEKWFRKREKKVRKASKPRSLLELLTLSS